MVQYVKDPPLSLLWHGWLLGRGFDLWPRHVHMPQVGGKKNSLKNHQVNHKAVSLEDAMFVLKSLLGCTHVFVGFLVILSIVEIIKYPQGSNGFM